LLAHAVAFRWLLEVAREDGEAFREGYLSVGDMARRDEDGFYYLVDRKTDMINPGGENIYPSAVENLLGARPKVKDVAVIGRPDAKWGGSVHAVIVLRDYTIATEWEIPSGALTPIAGYKRPRSVSCPSRLCRGPPPERSCTASCVTSFRGRRELATGVASSLGFW